MRPRRRPVSLLAPAAMLLLVALSGCTGEDGALSSATASFDDTTGGIIGLVIDHELVPVEGVEVGLLDGSLSTVSDADGRFAFSNVPPGEHRFHFVRIGYEPHVQTVSVEAGRVTEFEVRITGLALAAPFKETHTQRGLFGCGTSWTPGMPPPPVPGTQDLPKIDDPTDLFSEGNFTDGLPNRVGGVAGCGTLSGPAFEDTPIYALDDFSLAWEVNFTTAEWQTSIFEAKWTTNQLAGRGLNMNWEVERCFNRPEYLFSRVAGASPLYGRADHEQIQSIIVNSTTRTDLCPEGPEDCNEDQCKILSRIFATPETTGTDSADIGVSFQQQYELFHTFFFLQPAPEGWTALEES